MNGVIKKPLFLYTSTLGSIVLATLISLVITINQSVAAATYWQRTFSSTTSTNGSMRTATLTDDYADYYITNLTNGTLSAKAPMSNEHSNFRQVIWPTNTARAMNSQSCATWSYESARSTQQGLAHRIISTTSGTRAITVTKNVIYNIHWVFNVHIWDSSSDRPFIEIAKFDMKEVMFNDDGTLKALPWRVCSRTVGNTLAFKIWFPNEMSEPSWSDPAYTRSTSAIPAGYVVSGSTGWYAGHIPAGGSMQYTTISTWNRTTTR